MLGSATFSKDHNRRFDLVRDWRDEPGTPDKTLLVTGLNPSKAGAIRNDPTVRKTVGFARRWGYGRVVLVNLNPIISTDPWALPSWCGLDPENQETISRWVAVTDLVVIAWGSQPQALLRTIAFPDLVYAFRKLAPEKLYCIGTTKNGNPRHPSRAPYTDKPVRYRWESQ